MTAPVLPLLDMRGLCCQRGGRTLFRDLHCRLHAGQCLALRGANGSGKSTLLRIAAGLYRDFEGKVRRSPGPILYLGHTAGLKEALSVRENLQWFAALYAVPSSAIETALERLGLDVLAERQVAELSAGQRQRTALARLLLVSSPLWILDEPFAALDQQGVYMLRRMLAAHAAQGGGALLAAHQGAMGEQSSGLQAEPFPLTGAGDASQASSPAAAGGCYGAATDVPGQGGAAAPRDVPGQGGALLAAHQGAMGEQSSGLQAEPFPLTEAGDASQASSSAAAGGYGAAAGAPGQGGVATPRDAPRQGGAAAPRDMPGQGGALPAAHQGAVGEQSSGLQAEPFPLTEAGDAPQASSPAAAVGHGAAAGAPGQGGVAAPRDAPGQGGVAEQALSPAAAGGYGAAADVPGQGGALPATDIAFGIHELPRSPSEGSVTEIFFATLRRDFLLLFRERGALLRPPLFLLAATLLIPLGQGPLPAAWGGAAGLIWAFAFLAMLLAADTLCRDDLQDGSLDQIFVASKGLPWAAALARVLLCWFSAGVMVAIAAPVAGLLLNLPGGLLPVLVAGLLLGGIPLAALGAAGAALCAGVRGGGLLLPLIILPLALPVLIFGASASAAAAAGFSPWPALALLGACSLLALALLPLAVSTGWRISVEI